MTNLTKESWLGLWCGRGCSQELAWGLVCITWASYRWNIKNILFYSKLIYYKVANWTVPWCFMHQTLLLWKDLLSNPCEWNPRIPILITGCIPWETHCAKSTTVLEFVWIALEFRRYSNGIKYLSNIYEPIEHFNIFITTHLKRDSIIIHKFNLWSSLLTGKDSNDLCANKGESFIFGLEAQMISLWCFNLCGVWGWGGFKRFRVRFWSWKLDVSQKNNVGAKFQWSPKK